MFSYKYNDIYFKTAGIYGIPSRLTLGINMFNNKLRHNDLFLEKRSTIEIVTKYVNASVDMVIVVFAVIISEYM